MPRPLWPALYARWLGPFDESDEVNHDPDSWVGEEDDRGFDDMPVECGWEDEGESDDEEGDDDGEDE